MGPRRRKISTSSSSRSDSLLNQWTLVSDLIQVNCRFASWRVAVIALFIMSLYSSSPAKYCHTCRYPTSRSAASRIETRGIADHRSG